MVSFDYTGKEVLITGGSSGIGLATAKAFHAAGAHVIIMSRSPESIKSEFESYERLTLLSVDLNSPIAINKAFEQLTAQSKIIDIAINSAAAETGIGKPIQEFTEEEYDYTFGVNLKGLWLCMKHQIRLMLSNSSSKCSILNISSVNGLGGVEYGSLYAATKAGVLALSKSAALELATSHITVNAIVPGAFDTPLLRKALLSQCGGDESKLPEVREKYEQVIPRNRIGNPAEVASLILWLASGEADYLTGHSVVVDGGTSARFR
ncbi:SDR family NAD(P)-dependent oxidoreductase [Pontibacter kalidii]|uniref:SDR family NAD(P)-dependent oxidoreductase n=1 Tax=Pontibacter kalidii TaxID=2592049 RepID=UPI002258A73C|nr:SDR family oxidoreductase [Pontibacter kalidii]